MTKTKHISSMTILWMSSMFGSLAFGSSQDWYAGTWDSTLYNWSTAIHPRTIGVRVEVVDSRTGRPVRDARIELGGWWEQERLGRQEFGVPAVQEKEYKLTARTNHNGIAVFGLSWQKEVPWSLNRPKDYRPNGSWTYAESWFRSVDDIEKVQKLSVRHPDYNMIRSDFNFDKLTEFGQEKDSEYQLPEIHESFRLSWENMIGQSRTRFCVLQVEDQLNGKPSTGATDAVFFEKLRDEDFDIIYTELPNLSGLRSPRYAGPFFVILLELELDPVRNETTIVRPGGNDRDEPDQYDQQENEDRLRMERQEQARIERVRKERERKVRQERERREKEARAERERKEKEARAERERKEREEARKHAREKELQREASRHPLGLAVETLTSARRKELGLALGIKGVEILYVESGSVADGEFRVGDVIVDIKHRSVQGSSDFHGYTDDLESGDQILISIFRKRGSWDRMTKNVMVGLRELIQ